jgi:hypothetical protein
MTKDLLVSIHKYMSKINKQNLILNSNLNDFMIKECAASLKGKDSKFKKTKKVINKENCAVNKEFTTYKEVLDFMKLPEGSLISKANVLQAINAFIKNEKTNNNPDIFSKQGDNRKFVLINELKVLFDFIRKQMIARGDLSESDDFPTELQYIQIMKYTKYCFPEIQK